MRKKGGGFMLGGWADTVFVGENNREHGGAIVGELQGEVSSPQHVNPDTFPCCTDDVVSC